MHAQPGREGPILPEHEAFAQRVVLAQGTVLKTQKRSLVQGYVGVRKGEVVDVLAYGTGPRYVHFTRCLFYHVALCLRALTLTMPMAHATSLGSGDFVVRAPLKEVGYLEPTSLALEKEYFKFGTDLVVSARATGLEVPLVVSSCVR